MQIINKIRDRSCVAEAQLCAAVPEKKNNLNLNMQQNNRLKIGVRIADAIMRHLNSNVKMNRVFFFNGTI